LARQVGTPVLILLFLFFFITNIAWFITNIFFIKKNKVNLGLFLQEKPLKDVPKNLITQLLN